MKKILMILALALTTGIFVQTQAKSVVLKVNEIKTKQKSGKTGEKIFITQADKSLELIKQAAQKLSIKGVAIVAFIPGELTDSWTSKMKVVGHLTNNKDNLLGIASTKAAEMADTHKDSGSGVREIYSGELGYKGGLIRKVKSGYILAVFSGGSSEQDMEVAKIGLDWLLKFY